MLDKERYEKLGYNLQRYLICSSLTLKLGSSHLNFSEPSFLGSLQTAVLVISPEDSDPVDVSELIVEKVTDMTAKKEPKADVTQIRRIVGSAVSAVINEDESDPLYNILVNRLKKLFTQISLNQKPDPIKGFDMVLDEIIGQAKTFARIVDFNRKVYGPYYARILREASTQGR